jgi:hypothetical protein
MNYFVIILQRLTVDGWVVIALCGVMFVISLLVMIGKGLTLRRAKKDNAAFLAQYRNVDVLINPDHSRRQTDPRHIMHGDRLCLPHNVCGCDDISVWQRSAHAL